MPGIDYELIRSSRRTISITVTCDSAVIVRAPLRAPKAEIERFLEQKRQWVLEKRALALKRAEAHKPREFASGEEFPYLGRKLMLAVSTGTRRMEAVGDTLAIPRTRLADAGKLIKRWYSKQALDVIAGRVRHYSAYTGIIPVSVAISGARKRWGSCSSTGKLNFAWRLVMAPVDVIDYVVVHELAHIEHHNHSKAFWGRVGEIMPDYKAKKKWLKENDGLLKLF